MPGVWEASGRVAFRQPIFRMEAFHQSDFVKDGLGGA